jgi:hypothetical protein
MRSRYGPIPRSTFVSGVEALGYGTRHSEGRDGQSNLYGARNPASDASVHGIGTGSGGLGNRDEPRLWT